MATAIRLLAALACLALSAPPAAAQDAMALMQRASRAYRGLGGVSARFEQVIDDPMVGTFHSKGRLMQAGSRFAMRFTDPAGEAIVVDGRYVWVYAPSTTPGQVIRTPLSRVPTYGPNVLGWILDRPRERYRAEYLRADVVGGRSTDVIALTPVDTTLPFERATVWLDRADALPRQVQIRERSGAIRTLTLSELDTTPKLPEEAFVFRVPDDVRVVEQ
ncbi:MAG TPA: outer membrane lipoprotein carrier protein LolA [Gemmatimonadales bacterium]|nr:outer membrane lipoprotein carrier protein LolA [Gemmatimonadales bacterium]